MPNSNVIRFANSFWAESLSRFRTPDSRIRFPNIRKPISGTLAGAMMPAMAVAAMGKTIFTALDTFMLPI